MKKPKAQPETTEEKVMRSRQVEELARLDDEENTRVKRLVRGRLGAGSMLSGRRSSSRGARGSMVTSSGDGGGSQPRGDATVYY